MGRAEGVAQDGGELRGWHSVVSPTWGSLGWLVLPVMGTGMRGTEHSPPRPAFPPP